MSVPAVSAWLTITGTTYDLTEYFSQEAIPELTESIEAPSETNKFVAPEASFKGRDTSLVIWPLLRALSPLGGDNELEIWHDRGTASQRRIFSGFVGPNTIQWDDQERWFSFTAFGWAKALADLDATPLFQRWNITGWTVVNMTVDGNVGTALITKPSAGTCPFVSGDRISFATLEGSDELAVTGVSPQGSDIWAMTLASSRQPYGAGTALTLTTPYLRNARISAIVDAAFAAAFPTATVHYNVSTAELTNSYFASPLVTEGLPDGAVLGTSVTGPVGNQKPVVGSGAFSFKQTSPPTSPWQVLDLNGSYPAVDWTPAGSTQRQLYGYEWDGTGTDSNWYAYQNDIPAPGPYRRWNLRVTWSNRPPASWTTSGVRDYNLTVRLRYQLSDDGHTWGGDVTPSGWSDVTGVTTTDLKAVLGQGARGTGPSSRTLGIAYDPRTACVFFTEPYTLPGEDALWRLSSYDTVGLSKQTAIVGDRRGVVTLLEPGIIATWQLDSLDTTVAPQVFAATTVAGGTVVEAPGVPVLPTSVPRTLRKFGSTATYMTASATDGMHIQSLDGSLPRTQLVAPAADSGSDPYFSWLSPSPGVWAGILVANGLPWWISKTASAVISYVDAAGITVGDVLTQCAVVLDAVWYVDANQECWFRTRQLASGESIASGAVPSDVLDATTIVTQRRQPLWFRTYRYVAVANETNSDVYGEAGSRNFRGGVMGLEASARYAFPSSYCRAIAEHIYAYLGRGLTFLDMQVEDDGRLYQVGRTFSLVVDGTAKVFQITEVQRPLLAAVLRVQAVEL